MLDKEQGHLHAIVRKVNEEVSKVLSDMTIFVDPSALSPVRTRRSRYGQLSGIEQGMECIQRKTNAEHVSSRSRLIEEWKRTLTRFHEKVPDEWTHDLNQHHDATRVKKDDHTLPFDLA